VSQPGPRVPDPDRAAGLALNDTLQLSSAQGSKLVNEADARVQLCVACQTLLHAWHADEHQAHMAPIVEVAQLLESGAVTRCNTASSAAAQVAPPWLAIRAQAAALGVVRRVEG
jgi:hypothetical protein